MSNYNGVVDVIRNNESFLICSHAHPDGDGIGSTLAMGLALEAMGKKVTMYNSLFMSELSNAPPQTARYGGDLQLV